MLVWIRRIIKSFFEEMKFELDFELCVLELERIEWEKVYGWEYVWIVRLLVFYKVKSFWLVMIV